MNFTQPLNIAIHAVLVTVLVPVGMAMSQVPRSYRLSESVELTADVPYAKTDNSRQRLDILLPKEPKTPKPLPVIVYIHGGAWQAGSRVGGHRRLADYVSSGDYAGVSVGYRLTREAKWPAQIHDCKAAIRWIRGNAAQFNLDPDQIGVVGDSAGGHLSAMLGTSRGVVELEGDLGEHTDVSSSVQCVVDHFGPSDLLAMKDFPSRLNHDAPNSPEGKLVGGRVSDHPQIAASASPITYVSKDDPPFLIVHGDKDMVVPYDQSSRFAVALKAANIECSLTTVQGAGHGGFRNPFVRKQSQRFFDTHLRGKQYEFNDTTVPNERTMESRSPESRSPESRSPESRSPESRSP